MNVIFFNVSKEHESQNGNKINSGWKEDKKPPLGQGSNDIV